MELQIGLFQLDIQWLQPINLTMLSLKIANAEHGFYGASRLE